MLRLKLPVQKVECDGGFLEEVEPIFTLKLKTVLIKVKQGFGTDHIYALIFRSRVIRFLRKWNGCTFLVLKWVKK